MSDSSVVISGEFNTENIEKSVDELKNEAKDLAEEYEKTGMSSSEAFSKAWSEIKSNAKSGTNNVKACIVKLAEAYEKAGESSENAWEKASNDIKEISKNGVVASKAYVGKLASVYKKTGMSSSEAMKKAWSDINKTSKQGANSSKSSIDSMTKEHKKSSMYSKESWKKAWSKIKRDSSQGANDVKSQMNSISSLARKCAGILAGMFALNKIKDYTESVVKAGIGYNTLSEQAEVAWSTILGSNEAASSMMEQITNYAAKTPFSKMGVDAMAKQLSNAGFKGEALFDQLTKIGDMGSAFGIQEDSLREMVRQYAQVQQAGVAYTEDLNILQDRGIPIFKALADTLGVPVSETRKLASEGKITADVYNRAMDSIASNTKGAMENQSKTFGGMVSTMKDNLSILAGELTKPLFESMKKGLDFLMPKLENFITLVGTEGISGAISETFPRMKPLIDLFSDIGNVMVNTVIPAVTTFGGWVLDNIGPITFLASAIAGAVLAFKAMNSIMAIIEFVKGLKGAMMMLKDHTLLETVAQWGLNTAFLASPITWIVLAIGVLVAAFVYLWTTSEGFRNFWIGLWEIVKTAFVTAWNAIINFFMVTIPTWIQNIKNWFIGLPTWFGQLLESIKTWFITKWNEIWTYLFTNIPIWINNIFNWFNQLPYKIGFAIGQVLGKIIKWGSDTWSYFVTNVPKWINNIVKWFSELPSKIWTWLVNTLNKISSWGNQMWSKASSVASQFVSRVITYISELPGRLWTWLCNAVNRVSSWGGNLWSSGVNAAKQLVNAVVETVSSIPGKMLDIGRRIVEGVWQGITGAVGWFKDKIHGFFSGIVDGAKSALGIKSPARKMIPVGKYTVEGAEVGMSKQFTKLQKNMKNKIHVLVSDMKAKVQLESGSISSSIIAKSNHDVGSGDSKSITNNNDNGITQNITFNEPVDNPSDVARKVKQVGRDLIFG